MTSKLKGIHRLHAHITLRAAEACYTEIVTGNPKISSDTMMMLAEIGAHYVAKAVPFEVQITGPEPVWYYDNVVRTIHAIADVKAGAMVRERSERSDDSCKLPNGLYPYQQRLINDIAVSTNNLITIVSRQDI